MKHKHRMNVINNNGNMEPIRNDIAVVNLDGKVLFDNGLSFFFFNFNLVENILADLPLYSDSFFPAQQIHPEAHQVYVHSF